MTWRAVVLISFVLFAACSGGEPENGSSASSPDLDGTYRASIPASTFQGTELPKSFGGRWTLQIDSGEYVLEGPNFRVTEAFVVNDDDSVTISDVPAPAGAYNCFDEAGERLTPPGEVEASYSYVFDHGSLRLVPEEEPCLYRDLLLERAWKQMTQPTEV